MFHFSRSVFIPARSYPKSWKRLPPAEAVVVAEHRAPALLLPAHRPATRRPVLIRRQEPSPHRQRIRLTVVRKKVAKTARAAATASQDHRVRDRRRAAKTVAVTRMPVHRPHPEASPRLPWWLHHL